MSDTSVESPDRPSLGEFLRSRRERLSPEAVGLPNNGRRRTPGLRREELATLAGISVDYLVRLEQGRETNPSQAVAAALADALQLNQQESQYLGALVIKPRLEQRLCPGGPSEDGQAELNETTAMLLERLAPTPAFVLAPTTEVLAWNEPYERLMAATGLLDLDPPHLLRYTFLSPQSKEVFGDWMEVAREQVGNLRAASAGCDLGSVLMELVGELSVHSPDFATLWADLDVGEKSWGTKALRHPSAGDLELRYQAMLLPDQSHRRLVTYLPADEATAAALDDLVTPVPEPAPLRVVSGQ